MAGARGWWGLKNILDNDRMTRQQYEALPPDACPYCGTPLVSGFQTQRGGGKLFYRDCPMGDYSWRGGKRLT